MSAVVTAFRRAALVALALSFNASLAQEGTDLTEVSFEDLLDMEVTSVGKKKQALSDAAAAVYVISNEDIRRSGATSIPEALRMAPGVAVAQLDANKWSISSRGFNSRFANKLLVLIDGRTVYNPGFSGVYWESQDVVLDDIDRIEVIRGPGATLWGANAVNGVINIITKSAQETTGGLVNIRAGSEEQVSGTLRYGRELGSGGAARGYLKYTERDAFETRDGGDARDEWDITQGGFRFDRTMPEGDRFTLQGDIFDSDLRQQLNLWNRTPPTYRALVDDAAEASGWNLLGRWERPLTVSSDLSLQVYFDHSEREEAFVEQEYDVFDVDFQHRFQWGQRHDLVWGLGYRYIEDDFTNTETTAFSPASRDSHLWSAFVQDEIELIPDELFLTVGSKFEHNDFTDFEIQPNLRALWKAEENRVFWASVSRAVRTPSRAERQSSILTTVIPGGPPPALPVPTFVPAEGDSGYDSEELLAYELGFRTEPTPNTSIDLALFYNDYDSLRTNERGTATVDGSLTFATLPLLFDNKGSGHTRGVELVGNWRARDNLRWTLVYSYLDQRFTIDNGSTDETVAGLDDASPEHQLSLRSMFNPRPDIDLDLWVRYVDEIGPGVTRIVTPQPSTDSYWDLDVRVAWRPRPDVELSLVGQNLLESARFEGFGEGFTDEDVEVERGFYGSAKVEF